MTVELRVTLLDSPSRRELRSEPAGERPLQQQGTAVGMTFEGEYDEILDLLSRYGAFLEHEGQHVSVELVIDRREAPTGAVADDVRAFLGGSFGVASTPGAVFEERPHGA